MNHQNHEMMLLTVRSFESIEYYLQLLQLDDNAGKENELYEKAVTSFLKASNAKEYLMSTDYVKENEDSFVMSLGFKAYGVADQLNKMCHERKCISMNL